MKLSNHFSRVGERLRTRPKVFLKRGGQEGSSLREQAALVREIRPEYVVVSGFPQLGPWEMKSAVESHHYTSLERTALKLGISYQELLGCDPDAFVQQCREDYASIPNVSEEGLSSFPKRLSEMTARPFYVIPCPGLWYILEQMKAGNPSAYEKVSAFLTWESTTYPFTELLEACADVGANIAGYENTDTFIFSEKDPPAPVSEKSGDSDLLDTVSQLFEGLESLVPESGGIYFMDLHQWCKKIEQLRGQRIQEIISRKTTERPVLAFVGKYEARRSSGICSFLREAGIPYKRLL